MRWERTGCRVDAAGTVIVYSPPSASPLTIEQRKDTRTNVTVFAVVRDGTAIAARQTLAEAKRIAERYIYDEPAREALKGAGAE